MASFVRAAPPMASAASKPYRKANVTAFIWLTVAVVRVCADPNAVDATSSCRAPEQPAEGLSALAREATEGQPSHTPQVLMQRMMGVQSFGVNRGSDQEDPASAPVRSTALANGVVNGRISLAGSLRTAVDPEQLLETASAPSQFMEMLESALRRTSRVPLWHRIVFSMATVVCLAVTVFALMARPPAAMPTKEAELDAPEVLQLRSEQEQLRAKAEELEARLEALQRSKEELKEETKPEIETETETETPVNPLFEISNRELKQKVNQTAMQTEAELRQRVATAVENVAPVVAKVAKVKRSIEDGIESAREAAVAKAREEATKAAEVVFEVLDEQNMNPYGTATMNGTLRWIRGEVNVQDKEQASLPLTLILAGLCAPVQLQVVATWNRVQLLLVVLLLFILSGAMAFDVGRPCGNGTIWLWAFGLLCIFTITVAVRLLMISSAAGALREIHGNKKDDPTEIDPAAGLDAITSLQRRVAASSDSFFKALMLQDHVNNSAASSMLNFLNFAHVVWGFCGVVMTWQSIVEDSEDCRATTLRLFTHVYGFIYVMLLSFTLPVLLIWVLNHLLAYRSVSYKVLAQARQVDKESAIGIPVMTLLCQALLLRRVTDLGESERNEVQGEMAAMQTRKDTIDKRSAEILTALEAKKSRFQALLNQIQEMQAQAMNDKEGATKPDENAETEETKLEQVHELARMTLERAKANGVDLERLLQQAREALQQQQEQPKADDEASKT